MDVRSHDGLPSAARQVLHLHRDENDSHGRTSSKARGYKCFLLPWLIAVAFHLGPFLVSPQTLLKESVTGKLHLVDSVAQNHGAPYSDSFSVVTHYVLHKTSASTCRLRVASEVVFRKGIHPLA